VTPDGQPRRHGPLGRLIDRDDALGKASGRLITSLPVRALTRFQRISGRDRILILAGQMFTALVPLFILLAALAPRDDALPRRLIARFRLSGGAADAVQTLFARPPGATGTLSLLSALVMFSALLSFTRSLQRAYEAAWDLPPAGVRGTLNGLGGMVILLAYLVIIALISSEIRHTTVIDSGWFVVRVLIASVIWWQLQYLLLSRRIPRRRLVAGAVAAGIGQVVVSVYSAIWMPGLIQTNAASYGVIGVTFALLTWLIIISAGAVVSAVVSAEVGQGSYLERWVHLPGRGLAGLPAIGDEQVEDGREHRDQDRGQHGGPEAVDVEVTGQRRGDPEQGGIHDEREQTKGEDRQRQADQMQDRPEHRVDEAEEQGDP
jgi:membrane protein